MKRGVKTSFFPTLMPPQHTVGSVAFFPCCITFFSFICLQMQIFSMDFYIQLLISTSKVEPHLSTIVFLLSIVVFKH